MRGETEAQAIAARIGEAILSGNAPVVSPQDLRAIVRARMGEFGIATVAELARRMAPRWAALPGSAGCSPDSAERKLRRWFGHSSDMTSDALVALLAELGLEVKPTASRAR